MNRRDPVILSQKEQARLRVIGEVAAGRWSVAEAGVSLGLSQRQVRRLLKGLREQGARAFMHGNRGRPPPHRLSEGLRARVIELGAGRYAACNDSHFRELLIRNEGLVLSRASVQRLRRQAGQKPKQRRRPPQHRRRRDRRPQEGILLQVDGSPHHWFGPQYPACTLLAAIDDATGKVVAAVFRAQEDAHGYFLVLRQVLCNLGIPLELYHDRHGIFQENSKRPWTLAEELAGKREPTQFGRALEELGIMSLSAHSPAAKGRIERLWATWQDRLVVELELAAIKDLKAANNFLPRYLKRHNERFAQPAEEPGLAYRPLDSALDLDHILSFRYQRTVARDNTVRLGPHLLQIPPGARQRSYAGARVWVHELLDGSLAVRYQDRWLVRGRTSQLDPRLRARQRRPAQPETAAVLTMSLPLGEPPPAGRVAVSPGGRPRPDHPWRRPLKASRRTESASS